MKNLLLLFVVSFIGTISLFAQITPNGNSGSTTTAYTNGSPNDPIYIWCAEGLSNNTASLTATPASGTGPWTFNWYYHNQTNSSWTSYSTNIGATSTISNLPSDAYRVQIYDNGGVLVGCYTALVWNMNGQVTASNSPTACNGTNLTGTVAANGSFTYYNPPPPESLISASTQISVCFSATHTYVSDLAFYLVGPASCGSPTILLSPNPGANGQGSVCNSNNNVSNLCFTTAAAPNFNPCNELCCGFLCFDVTGCTSNYSGSYDSYGPSSTLINWSALYGCNAAQGGWRVQIYDCIGADVGSLTNANISFSNLTSVCGSPTSINYTSGAINSAINDNSCSAATASIFQVPVSTGLTTPITINASTSYLWTSSPSVTIPNASTSLTPSVTGLPTGTTTFTLTATVTYGGTSCTYDETTAFINTCCTAIADAGGDVSFCSPGSSQIGTPSVAGMTYSWSPTTGLNDATLAQPTVTLSNGGGSPLTSIYTLTVTNTLDGGCTATDDVNVTVNPIPVVNAGLDQPVCEGTSVTLSGSGATTYSWDNGVSNGISFIPAVGSVTYTVTGTASGCTNTDQVVVTVNALPTPNAGSYSPVCIDASNVALAGTPSGGTFSGTGVSGNSFSPASGTQTITYTYTDANSCTNTANTTITVNNLPVVSAGTYSPVCVDAADVTLVGSPVGGTFSGTGVSGNNFDPSNGTQTITYTYTDGNSCTNSGNTSITVNALPLVDAGTYSSVCADAPDVVLAGTPVGGTFSGTGVSGNNFDPSAGTQTITYTYTDGNSCTNSTNTTITVNNPSAISAGTYSPVCEDAGLVNLSGTPSGGVFSGTGVSGNTFDPASGTQTITYTYVDGNGCGGSADATITVNNLPAVDAGSNLSLCSGSSVVLNGSGVGTPTWSPSTELSSASVMDPTATPTTTTTYTLTIDDGLCISSDVMTITVTDPPALVLTPNTTICVGDCIALDVSGADFYNWSPETGISNTAASTQNVCPATTTTYTVEGYVIGGSAMVNGDFEAGPTGFSSDYTLNSDTQSEGTYYVTTNANLTHPGFTGVDHTTGSGNFLVVNGSSTPNSSVWCQTVTVQPNTEYVFSTWVSTLAVGSPAILQFSINGNNLSTPFTAPSGTGQWIEFFTTWNSGLATSATICVINQNTSLGGNDFGLDDISFSAVCSSTSSVTITVNEMANATITPAGPFCVDAGSTNLSAAQTGGTWSGTGITDTTNGTFNPAIAGPGTHSITYTIAGACGDVDVIQIDVNSLPVIDAGIDQTVCAGEQVTLTGSGAPTLVWSDGISNGTAFIPVNTVTYTLTGTDVNGCLNSDQVTVTVNPLPAINAGADQTICLGSSITLNGSGGTTYTWSDGVTNGVSFTPSLGSTVFYVTGTDANGCANIDSATVTVLTVPVAEVSADIYSGYSPLVVNFTNSSTFASSYVWDFGNGPTVPANNLSSMSSTYTGAGTYQVVLLASNGICSNTDTLSIVVIPFPDPIIHVPNVFTPNSDGANDFFYIDHQYVAAIHIIILNRWGNLVFETEDLDGKWDGTDMSEGVYFFKYIVTGINESVLEGHGNVTLLR